MLAYAVTRLLQAIPVIFMTSVIVFVFIRMIPGDPAIIMAGQNATPEQVAALRERYGLTEPLVTQYVTWIGRLAQGDLGTAYTARRPISELILHRIPATLHLAAGAMSVMLLVGVPIGIFVAVRPFHVVSKGASFLTALAFAVPSFWLGILLLLLFAVRLQWLPASGYVSITESPVEMTKRLILPSLTLGTFGTGVLVRFLSSSIREVMDEDFIRVAYAKGLRERMVILRHTLRIALLPVITIMAIQFGNLLGGAVITEAIFGWPGIGRLMIDAIHGREYLIVQSTMLIFITVFIVLNILADIGYALLDPRIRYGK